MEEVTSSSEELNPKSKREFWVSHIQAWEQSGLSQVAYCRKNDLKMHRWWYWRKRISTPSATDVTFVPLGFSSSKISQSSVSVVTPNGYRIEIDNGYDITKLRQLVSAVRGL